ncbi:hypothetical protein [Streptomyces alkaliterrae]|uniref:Uncharacterized protein n=1 Tax=Streptomyces alkaliterrae TaxID=2213162 RepID=A0A5P0YM73_9ACTN|nr:hypothetical protein [Streptomyces alkaliterrae]MBB1260433.1 hypothetical protein [Streptomyces alkaliterrae]MQS01454.1 hypothetical protein [Streptomyces alkaliterrae]
MQTVVGVTLIGLGVGGASAGGSAARGDVTQPILWIGLAGAVVFGLIGGALFHNGRKRRVHGERLRSQTIGSFENSRDSGTYVAKQKPEQTPEGSAPSA